MPWSFSQALVAEFSAASCSDTDPSARSKSTSTADSSTPSRQNGTGKSGLTGPRDDHGCSPLSPWRAIHSTTAL